MTFFFFCLLELKHNLKHKSYMSPISSNVLFIGSGERERERSFTAFSVFISTLTFHFMMRSFKKCGGNGSLYY